MIIFLMHWIIIVQTNFWKKSEYVNLHQKLCLPYVPFFLCHSFWPIPMQFKH
jgi:hypothetical protein